MKNHQSACLNLFVFGGSNTKEIGEFLKEVSEIDIVLVARKINVVYGGNLRLKGMCNNIRGSKVFGVHLKCLDDKKYIVSINLRVSSMPK